MRFTYDPESGAMYARIREGRIEETLELGGGCYLDIAPDGMVMGLECLSLDEFRGLVERSGGELDLPDRVVDAGEVFKRSERDPLSLEGVTDPASKRVMELHFMEGLSYAEIADILSLSVADVRRRMRAGLREFARSRSLETSGGETVTMGRVALYESGRLLLTD